MRFFQLSLAWFVWFLKVKDYDYYGAYGVAENKDYKYNELLGQEYTFDFPPHHDIVRKVLTYFTLQFMENKNFISS